MKFIAPIALLLTIGCGGSDGGDSPDAMQATEVMAQVLDASGEPATGIAIVFHDANGAVVAEATSDAQGMATTDLAAANGGFVTFAYSDTNNRRLFTVGGVAFGETATHIMKDEGSLGDIDINITNAPANASSYFAITKCGSDTLNGNQTMEVDTSCLNQDGGIDVLVVAYDKNTVLGYSMGVVTSPPSLGSQVAYNANSFVTGDPTNNWEISITNADAALTAARIMGSGQRIGKSKLHGLTEDALAPLTNGAATLNVDIIDNGATGERFANTLLSPSFQAQPGYALLESNHVNTGTDLSIDGSKLMKLLTNVAGSDNNGRAKLAWNYNGQTAKGTAIETRWTAGNMDHNWDFIIPTPSNNEFTVLELPASLNDWQPPTGNVLDDLQPNIILFNVSGAEDFAASRAMFTGNFGALFDSPPLGTFKVKATAYIHSGLGGGENK